MKDHNVDLSFGPENIPDQNPDEEDKSKASCSAPDSSNGFDDASTLSGASLNNDNNNRKTGTASGSDGSCDARSESPAGGGGVDDTVQEEVVGFKLFNEDLVCSHYQLNPQAVKFYIPEATYCLLVYLCGEDIHPATVLDDFEACRDCQVSSMNNLQLQLSSTTYKIYSTRIGLKMDYRLDKEWLLTFNLWRGGLCIAPSAQAQFMTFYCIP